MNEAAVWQCASVAEFFGRFNWDGPAAKLSVPDAAVLASTPAIASHRNLGDRELLCLSVRDFFSALNWKDVPVSVPVGRGAIGISGSPLTLSVEQFVRSIDWEGMPEVGVAPHLGGSSRSKSDNGLRADRFPDLF
ncbi:MAG: hypothetical protein AAFY15_16670 [Cyanobacteria bacterium J06648_11]